MKKYLGLFILIFVLALIGYYFVNNSKEKYIPVSIKINQTYSKLDLNKKEGCLRCHNNMVGFSKFHNPNAIGCVSCHLGNAKSSNKEEAHKGMILIPGNLSDAQQTCGKCHHEELKKIENSLMTTNSGIVAVDKYIFGEADNPNYHYHIKDVKNTPSDKHIRDLCANCHLGAEKKEFGPITTVNRGGGCNACHLNYTKSAEKDLSEYLKS
ncbi:MAG: hypothetical protein ACWA42_03365, partial [Lutibacter sp.]